MRALRSRMPSPLGADADLSVSGEIVKNGYQDLLGRLCAARMHVVLVRWIWGYRFAMWLVVPGGHAGSLRNAIEANRNSLAGQLRRRWTDPRVVITIV